MKVAAVTLIVAGICGAVGVQAPIPWVLVGLAGLFILLPVP